MWVLPTRSSLSNPVGRPTSRRVPSLPLPHAGQRKRVPPSFQCFLPPFRFSTSILLANSVVLLVSSWPLLCSLYHSFLPPFLFLSSSSFVRLQVSLPPTSRALNTRHITGPGCVLVCTRARDACLVCSRCGNRRADVILKDPRLPDGSAAALFPLPLRGTIFFV